MLITYLRKRRPVKREIAILTDHTYLPDRVGGREISIHELALDLQAAGWLPTIIARKSNRLKSFPIWSRERYLSPCRIIRTADPIGRFLSFIDSAHDCRSIVNLDNRNLPDFVTRISNETFVYYRDLQDIENISGRSDLGKLRFIANSDFVANGVETALGRRPITVPPLIRGTPYENVGGGDFVTFVNPIPKKGLDIAIGLARRLPNIPFLFLESWPLGETEWKILTEVCRPYSNIVLRHSSLSMAPIYRKTQILLAPSQWVEAWGRVVTEAQFNGIPAVTSDTGGLPEAVGRGGIVLPRNAPIDDWASAVQCLYENKPYWSSLSKDALTQAHSYARYRDAQYSELRELLA